jgi:M-phase inducer tyrosine phosphatase
MYEHPEDVIKQERSTVVAPSLPSIMDTETAHVPQLPHFVSQDEAGDLPRITKETLCEVLDGKYDAVYDKFVIVDCRFEYEYNGGHISGAVNFNDKEQLATQLFTIEPTSRALLIFHCEYSAHRAPIMAKFIRNRDRKINEERYPNLTYPETYILDGGYSAFFKDYRLRCFPQNYVEMDAKEHAHACERALGKVKQRSKLMRAQTFTFGDHSSPTMGSSPTAQGRVRADTDMDMDFGSDFKLPTIYQPFLDPNRIQGRRMLSY